MVVSLRVGPLFCSQLGRPSSRARWSSRRTAPNCHFVSHRRSTRARIFVPCRCLRHSRLSRVIYKCKWQPATAVWAPNIAALQRTASRRCARVWAASPCCNPRRRIFSPSYLALWEIDASPCKRLCLALSRVIFLRNKTSTISFFWPPACGSAASRPRHSDLVKRISVKSCSRRAQSWRIDPCDQSIVKQERETSGARLYIDHKGLAVHAAQDRRSGGWHRAGHGD